MLIVFADPAFGTQANWQRREQHQERGNMGPRRGCSRYPGDVAGDARMQPETWGMPDAAGDGRCNYRRVGVAATAGM